MKHILAIDIGGNTVKVLVSGEKNLAAFIGPDPNREADGRRRAKADRGLTSRSRVDRLSRPRSRQQDPLEPVNLGSGWGALRLPEGVRRSRQDPE